MYQVPISGQAINTAQISIGTTITSGNISCTNISGTNATFNQLTTTTFNPANLNTSNVDTQNLTVANSIPLLNVSVLNASQKNVSNMSVENLSVGTITADNISTGALIPGTNINISNNVISAVNDALLPANANFSSVNSCSLSVTGTTILGGTAYLSDSLVVTDSVNCSTITANNLSTGDMEIVSPLIYNSSTKQLECEVLTTPVSGSTLPVSSGALYNVLGNISEQASLMHTSLYRRGLSSNNVTIVTTSLSAGSSGYLFYVDYHPKYEDSLIKVTAYFSYSIGGHGSDNSEFKLIVGRASNTITRTDQIIYQQWGTNAGSGTRSGAGSAVGGVYPQEDSITSGLFHRIHIYYQNNGDDTFSLTDSGDYISMEVLETLDTQTSYNNNIRIGTGNISANNMSLTGSLTVNPGSGFGTPVKIGRTTIGNVDFDNMLSMGVDNNNTGTTYGFGQVANNQTIMNAMSSTTHNSFRVENVETMRNTSVGLGIKTSTDPTNALEVNGTITCTTFEPTNLNASQVTSNTMLVQSRATLYDVDINGDVDIRDFGSLSSFNNSFDNVSANNLSLGNISATNITATSITASNLSTASLTAGTNISILNGSISAYIEGGTDWDVSSIHVDNDVGIAGNLNVSETSTFEQSLNVQNQLFVGDAGNTDGSIVLYSNLLGNNFVISNNIDDTCSITGEGTTSEINISLGGNEIVEFLNNTVNINGRLNVSNISINSSVDVAELTTSEINISDTNNVSEYTRIHRQGDQTFFVGNNNAQGCDYKFYTGTDSQTLALEINRSLTTTINRLEVVNTMESVNICTDNNISCGGSLSVVGNINASEINSSSLIVNGNVSINTTGNISCNNICVSNISCIDITCEDAHVINFSAHLAFIDGLYIEEVNNTALIAMGYTPTGIASESLILMASGGTGDGTVEIENGSTDFNISSRGSGKTYRFSSNQVPLLEITDTNTSCMDLNVNGDLVTTGSLDVINASVSNDLDVDGTIDTLNLLATDATITTFNVSTISTSGNLNVSGLAYFEENGIFFDNIIMYGDFLTLGDTNGGSNSELYIYSNTAGDYMQMGHVNASEFRFKLYNVAESMNFVISNSSILVLDNSEARFHKNVNLSYTLSANVLQADDANIELVNASNMSADVAEITTLNGNFFSVSTLVADDFVNNTEMRTPLINVSTINASTINGENLSTASILFSSDFQFSLNTLSLAPSETSSAIQSATLAAIATQVNSATGNFSTILSDFGTIGGGLNVNTLNVSIVNYSSAVGINLSATNISATSITAPDVQPTLTAGTNITIVGNTISATGGSSFDPTNISNTNLSSSNITTTNLSSTNISVGASGSIGNILGASTAFGHKDFFNSDDVAIHQFSGGSTHINCDAGAGVAIRSGGLDIANFNTTNVSLNYPLLTDTLTSSLFNNHQNYIRYTHVGTTALTSSQTFVDVNFGGNNNLGYKPNYSLVSDQSSRTQFTTLKSGYYRFFCSVPVWNNTYANRVVFRLRPVVGGATSGAYGEGYCYTRHDDYGNRGMVTAEVIRPCSNGLTFRFRLDCGKASFGSSFGSDMGGLTLLGGRYVEIQYLGES